MLKLELVKASDGIYETVCSGISVEVMPLQSHSRSIIPSQKWMVFFDGFAITDDDFSSLGAAREAAEAELARRLDDE